MSLSLHQLREVAHAAGVPDRALSALWASTMLEESDGHPSGPEALGDYVGDRPTSFGLLQVHEPDWPEIVRATRGVMAAPFVTDYGKAVAEARLALPILQDAAKQALEAARVLRDRGYPADLADTLVMIDAAWQGPGVLSWAHRTSSGDPADIREDTAPGRGARVRQHLAAFGIGSRTGGRWGWVAPVALVGAGMLALWGVVEAMEKK